MFRTVILTLSLMVFCVSCVSYHFGTNGQFLSKTYVSDVINKTAEPQLGSLMHRAMSEQLSTAPSRKNKKTIALDMEIVSLENSSWARAEVRDKKSRDSKDDAYQTVLYRIQIRVNYKVFEGEKILLTGSVIGLGDVPKMHDRNVPLQNALKLATNDAARQILAALADN